MGPDTVSVDSIESFAAIGHPHIHGSATWRTFLDQHLKELVAIDFLIVPPLPEGP